MALTRQDITLEKFLNKFTYTGDPQGAGKIELPIVDFVKICADLKICEQLERLRMR